MEPMGRPQLIDMKQNMGSTLCKTYGIKTRCYWEHPWGTHWELREHIRNLMRTHWELREHIRNLMRTHWELEWNMLGTKENYLRFCSRDFRV
jgi:hypothetical protein